MRRLLLLVATAALILPGAALAHPLGNFTVNRYAGIELSGNRVYVEYALDLAEIPTLQERPRFRRPGIAAELGRRLRVVVDGRRVALRPLDSRVALRPGAAGLKTLRFDAVFDAGPAGRSLEFRDRNYPERLGWKEVVVHASRGARLRSSDAPARSISRELRSYPQDLLRDPADTTSARASIDPGDGTGVPPSLGAGPPSEHRTNGFESLIGRDDLTPGLVVLSLALALFWGAAHALTPGHGKAVVAAYMVGSRGKVRHAFALGGIVTVTHTIGVFGLGIVTLALSQFVVPEDLYPWLNLVSALLVVGVGVTVLRQRLAHRHAHHHHHDHDHRPGGLVAAGISGGLLPCPTALVVLLAAISLHRVGFGLLLIFAFSLGLASVVTGIGVLAISARRLFGRTSLEGGLVRALPAVSAAAIVALGLVMTLRSLPTVT
jgi:ABC-type nickel/cobalt efflux system permease component RcnA